MQIQFKKSTKYLLFFIVLISIFSKVDAQETTKKSVVKTSNFFKQGDLSLFGALSFSNQTVNDRNITAPVNYLYSSVNSTAYNSGYTGGFRWDGVCQQKHNYSIIVAVSQVNAGSHYSNKYSLSPFIEEFTHFKADKQFTTINIAAHFKKLLPVNDMNKYKFYAVFGPSVDYKISSINKESLLNGAGNRAIVNADLGTEFDNKGYYVLYAHYKFGGNLFNSSVPLQLNRFELGMSIKVKDLF